MAKTRSLNHQIWDIAGPAILANLSIPLLGMVDIAILGHLGNARYLGAVAIGSAVLSFLYWGFSFLRMGTTGLVAKAMGAGEERNALLVLAQSGVLALVLAVLVVVFHSVWLRLGLALMAPGDELAPLALSYATLRIYSAPAVLVTYACVGWFIGRRDTRWPMLIIITTNATNIALDFLFIIGLQLNSDGAALATVAAEYLGCALALYGVWRNLPERPDALFYRKLAKWQAYRLILRSSRHLLVRTTCLLFSFAFFTSMGEKLGSEVLAANAILMQLLLLAAYGMDGFAYAAEALSGTRVGARDMTGFYAVVRRCGLWCAASAILVSVIFALFSSSILALFTDLEPIQAIMWQYRWWLIAIPLIAAPSYLLDGIFIGTAETRYMMYTMLFSTLIIYLPAWYLTRAWGNHGLWLAFALFNGARGLSLQLCYWHLKAAGGWLGRENVSQ